MEEPRASNPSQNPSSGYEAVSADGPQSPTINSVSPETVDLSPKPPSLRQSGDLSSPMNASSAPLGPVNAARRPVPPTRASGLTSDIQAKMKAFSLSRQGAPPSAQSLRPGLAGQQASSTGSIQSRSPVGGPLSTSPGSPSGSIPAGLRLPPGINRPNAPNWNSTPAAGNSRTMGPKISGLAAKRGLKPGGMKLSDATKPPEPSADGSQAANQDSNSGSQFNKFSNIVDTKAGTLNFKNKAIIHGSGIDFDTGTSFSISLDEVDTIDELGKGNYGTVFKVRHARPKMRRPGQGLRGNMSRQSSMSVSSVNSVDSVESTQSAPASTSGLIMAMKEIRLELEDSKFAAIIMELDILHRCISPFIISFFGGFFQEGSVYICMEHMDGGSIDKLYGGGVPEGVLKKITLSTVMGLKYLKDEHNIIHRDVKPTNILVNTRGQVKICDFGVSGNLVASIAKTNIGCQSYMAPERISGGGMAQAGANPGGGTYSVQSDIWSLGLTIIECALGRYPYPPETYDNIFSQLSAIVDGEPPDLPKDTFSAAAHDFVRGCLNKIPKMRPTYAMLLRHAWLSPLLQPPTISEDEEAEAAAEAGDDLPNEVGAETADKEVAEWVKGAIERKLAGKMKMEKKPALHEAPLDAVPGRPLLHRDAVMSSQQVQAAEEAVDLKPNPGVRVVGSDLNVAKVESVDFAGNDGILVDGAPQAPLTDDGKQE